MNKSELKPLEVNGITAVTLGTLLWFLTFVLLFLSRDSLVSEGKGNWVTIAGSGFVLGLIGIRYTVRRKKKLNAFRPLE